MTTAIAPGDFDAVAHDGDDRIAAALGEHPDRAIDEPLPRDDELGLGPTHPGSGAGRQYGPGEARHSVRLGGSAAEFGADPRRDLVFER